MEEISIKIKNLSKVYKLYDKPIDRLKESITPFKKKYHRDFYALNNVSIEVKKGETIGIIGKNGSGKSTLLKIITGVLNPSAGNVFVNGKISALLELGAGFNPEFTGIENVYLNGTIMGYSKEDMDKKLPEILEFADIGDFENQPVKMYSSGMFVRLAFAVAINVEPDILIVDEALAVGDIRFQNKCLSKIREFRENNKTIIVVSHSTELLKSLCSKIYWLMDGSIYKTGSPKEISQEYLDFMTHGITHKTNETPHKEYTDLKLVKEENIEWLDVKTLKRAGNGKALIENIAFYDSRKPEILNIIDEETKQIIVKLKIHVFEEIEIPLIGVGFFNSFGQMVIHLNNQIMDKKIDVLRAEKNYIITYKFNVPRIRNGEYLLATSIDDGFVGSNEIVDRINDAHHFIISSSDNMSKQFGIALINDLTVEVNGQ